MAKLTIPADQLMELTQRPHCVTVNNVTWDPVYRRVTFDVVGSDVPDAEEVLLHKINKIEVKSGKLLESWYLLKPKREGTP